MSKYKKIAIHSLETEIKGLKSIIEKSINETFDKVIDTILNTKGKIILSGVGKPGYIAHRVATTLSSTGTMSFFVNANEASHGDMGMIGKDDVVVILSNSGESKELKDIITYCNRFNIVIIGLTRNKDSFLAKSSNIPVVLENIEQTNSVDSPTTSEIMFLSYLDAVATVLIDVKNFKKDDYKIFHPGGKLGLNLLKVEEIMHNINELPIVTKNTSMNEAIKIMVQKPLGCLLIVNTKNNLLGLITDGDFKRQLLKDNYLMNKSVEDIMLIDVITISKDMYVVDAINIMKKGNNKNNNYIQILPVIENNKLIGLLHIQDCLKLEI